MRAEVLDKLHTLLLLLPELQVAVTQRDRDRETERERQTDRQKEIDRERERFNTPR
jgi:hypothetical protein